MSDDESSAPFLGSSVTVNYEKMRLLVMSDASGRDGCQGMLRFVTAYWAHTLGWQIDVFFPHGGDVNDPIVKQAGMRPVASPFNGVSYHAVLINSIINVHYLDRLVTDIPMILWCHEANSIMRNMPWSINGLFRSFTKAARLVFQSTWQTEFVFKSFLFSLPPERIAIIPNALPEINVERRQAKHLGEAFKVACVGHVNGRKRQIDLVRALIELTEQHEIICDFVGNIEDMNCFGPENTWLFQNSPAFLRWHGQLEWEAGLNILKEADVFCFPSSDESFGLAPLEAAVLGVPVVLADLPVYRHIGWEHDKNCLFYPLGDAEALAECIRIVKETPVLSERLSQNGKAFAKNFDSKAFLQKMTAIIVDAIKCSKKLS
jgi:glycosyltransferase involved in cell wall biosynthesis